VRSPEATGLASSLSGCFRSQPSGVVFNIAAGIHGRNLAFRMTGLTSLCSPRPPFGGSASTLWAQPASHSNRNRNLETAFLLPCSDFPYPELRDRLRRSQPASSISLPCPIRIRSVLNSLPDAFGLRRGYGHRTRYPLAARQSQPILEPPLPLGVSPPPDHSAQSDSDCEVYLDKMPDIPSLPERIDE
jgi:hypothetical protein